MSTCYYHPQSKAKFNCPDCGEDVCDVCRIDGGMARCGNCLVNGPPPRGPRQPEPVGGGGGYDDRAGYADSYDEAPGGGTPAAHDMSAMLEVRCANHSDVTADMQCLNCLQAFCMACIPDGSVCAQCKIDPYGRAAPEQDYDVSNSVDVGYDPTMDFAGYDTLETGDAPAARPLKGGPKKAGAGAAAGGKKGAPAGKKGAKKQSGLPIPAIAGGVALLLALGVGGLWFMNRGGDAAFTGPAKVAIASPKAGALKGLQQITLTVASPEALELVTITVDGKYWDKFKEGPFKSEWQTSGLKNGKHVIEAVAQYKNGPKVKDTRTVTTNNPR